MIETAYAMFDHNRIKGMPQWAESANYDVQAKVDESDVATVGKLTYRQRLQMLQTLLADRFKLGAHIEQRTIPIYALVIGNGGPKFKTTTPDQLPKGIDRDLPIVTGSHPGEFSAINLPIAGVTESMDSWVDRPVVDKTGLNGRYDIKLKWSPEPGVGSGNAPLDSEGAGPSIFTAAKEQLGLRLEPQMGSVPFLVIDHLERPSAN